MLKLQIIKLVDMFIEKEICKNEDKEIIIHGLTSGIELIFNILTTIILGFIFGLVIESLVFLISFSFIRTYSGGYHCKSAINCYLFSSMVVVLVLFIVKSTNIEYILIISMIMLLISIPIIFKFAPVETATKPLDDIERKYFRNKVILHLYIELIVLIILLLFKLYILEYIIYLGIMVSAILILLGYKYIRRF